MHPKRKQLHPGDAPLLAKEFDDALVGRAWPSENPWLDEMVAVYDQKKAFNIYSRLKKKALKVEDPEFSSDATVINSEWSVELDFGLRDAGNRRPIFVDMIGRANRKTTGSPGKSKGPRPKIKG